MFRRLVSREVLGIDLGGDAVRIAHATKVVPGGIRITGFCRRDVTGLTDEAIVDTIGICLDDMEVGTPEVVAVIPSNLGITRSIEVPSVNPIEVKDIVNLQAARHTPYSREDVIVDYIDVGVYKGTYTRVLLVVVGHEEVRRQLDILNRAGLNVGRVVFGAEAVARLSPSLLPKGAAGAPRCVIHIDSATTDFIVTANDKPIFVRNIPLGASQLTADKGTSLSQFTEEIARSLEVYQSEEIDRTPGSFYFVGAVESVRDAKPVLDEALKMPSEIISYERHVTVEDSAIETMMSVREISFLPLVAAIHVQGETQVDLVPDEIKSRRQYEDRTREIMKVGILGLIVLFLVAAIFFSKIAAKNMYLDKLNNDHDEIIKEARQLEDDYAKVKWLEMFLSEQRFATDIMGEVYNFLPDGIYLENLGFDRKEEKDYTLRIEGFARERSFIEQFASKMGESEFFDEFSVSRMGKGESEEVKHLWSFELVCDRKAAKEEAAK